MIEKNTQADKNHYYRNVTFDQAAMHRTTALLSSALILGVIMASTTLAAFLVTPSSTQQSRTQTAVPLNIATATNSTSLTIRLQFPNGAVFSTGNLSAGSLKSQIKEGLYEFEELPPGRYVLNLTEPKSVFLPPTSLMVAPGANFLSITIYELQIVHVVESNHFKMNESIPGPPIYAGNGTAVKLVIMNNTTLIQNLAVVRELYNTNYSNVLFGSLSVTVAAGGSVSDTFVVNSPGRFYYECLIGTDARAGEWGNFTVLATKPTT